MNIWIVQKPCTSTFAVNFLHFVLLFFYYAYCTYRIYSAIRQGFPLSRVSTNNQISPLQFCCNTSLPFLNNPKCLDLSYKTDLDFCNCFGRKITPSYNRIWYASLKLLHFSCFLICSHFKVCSWSFKGIIILLIYFLNCLKVHFTKK